MEKFKHSYDADTDDLLLYNPKYKSRASVEFGNIIFDFNAKKKLVGIQLINASSILKDMIREKSINNMKQFLAKLKDCHVTIKDNSNMLIITFLLTSDLQTIAPTLSVPKITQTSPALAYT